MPFKELFPAPDAPHSRTTKAAGAHPVYTEEQMNAVMFTHRGATTTSDEVALAMVRVLRFGLDLAISCIGTQRPYWCEAEVWHE